jgi:hypothetical protein
MKKSSDCILRYLFALRDWGKNDIEKEDAIKTVRVVLEYKVGINTSITSQHFTERMENKAHSHSIHCAFCY